MTPVDKPKDPLAEEWVDDTPMPARPIRYILMALGCLSVVTGLVGIFLPVLPTTPFLLVALWCFARSSLPLRNWLFHHPHLGRYVRDWHDHQVVPVRAKVLAITMMSASFIYVVAFVKPPLYGSVGMAAVLLAVAVFLLTRPSRAPVS
ncbi:YbaN family protein [Rhodovibrionaceae bacterium A322]